MTTSAQYLVSLGDWFDVDDWPIAAIMPDELTDLLMVPPLTDPITGDLSLGVFVGAELTLRIPGVDAFWLVISPGAGGTLLTFDVHMSPFGLTLRVPLVLRVDANILRPVDSSDKPDETAKTFDVTLGEVDLTVTADGHVEFDLGPAHLPRCMVGTSGVIVQVGALKWLTPSTPAANLPPHTPAGFTGIFLDNVEVKVSELPGGLNALRLDDGFIGTGGFSGKVSAPNLNLDWDPNTKQLTGALHGDLFGFQGGLSSVALEFRQNALVGCDIAGDVYIPWFDTVVGLELGLTGAGEVTALVRMPHSPHASGVTAGAGPHLISIDVYGVLDINVDAVGFHRPATGPSTVEVTGSVALHIDGLDLPEVGVKALRIDTDGKVTIDGGWMELPSGTSSPFNGFPLEISKIGFGTEGTGASTRMWVGLSGAIKLADGLPIGGSVDGLKISWLPSDPLNTLGVTLAGVGLEFEIPNVVLFKGSVSFFDDGVNKGFRGDGHLALPSVGLGIDVDLVIGNVIATRQTFFYFHIGVDLPVGIPLFATGLAFYGFEGLVANNMGPDRRNGEPWYWGWYVRDPHGATNQAKWSVQPGAFAAGLGTTIGTLPDTAFTISAKLLFILVLPGPVLLLEGKGSFLRKKPTGSEEGIFEALLALDVPAKLFQANLAVTYTVQDLVTLHGGADVGFSWASPPPPHFWHLFLGEDLPMERRWQAELLSIFHANSYFMIEPTGLRLGAWIGFKEDWTFGPVRIWANAEISGEGEVSFRPQHLHGHMHLGGEAGVTAFGAKIVIGASADFDVSGPTPWHVEFVIEAHIDIDLWLFSFSWKQSIPLSWTEAHPTYPTAVAPLIDRLAFQHLVVDDGGDLQSAVVAPDARQVVVFSRPVRDLAGIGAPASATLPADVVGPARFSYQLGHVALHRRTGNAWTVVGASGFVDVTGANVTVPGLTLEGAAGGQLSLVGGATYPVTGASPGTVTVTGTVPGGRLAFRLTGPVPSATVQVTSVGALGAGLVALTLLADPGLARDVLGGGTLTVSGVQKYAIAGNQGSTIVVRTASTAPAVPPVGSATVLGPDGPRLEGAWMAATDGVGATKLMLGARTPFAQFHNNTAEVTEAWNGFNPGYACGPTATREPTCVTFDAVRPTALGQAPLQVETLSVTGSGDAFVEDVADAKGLLVRVIRLGAPIIGRGRQGSAFVTFTGPVDHVWVSGRADEVGTVTARLDGRIVGRQSLPHQDGRLELVGPIDELAIDGSLVVVSEICFLPDWTCLYFDAASFPQNTTARQSYAGVVLESAGTMRVDEGVLGVKAPGLRAARAITPELDDVHRRPLPFVDLLDRYGVHPSTPLESAYAQRVVPTIPGIASPTDVFLPGLGIVGGMPESPTPPRRGRLRRVPAGALDAAARVTLRADLVPANSVAIMAPRPPGDRVVLGGALTLSATATITVYFPRPVTRVRVTVDQDASVTVAAGPVLVATGVATAGSAVELDAGDGWVDRLSVSAAGAVRVREICTDAGDFGWQRFEQWNWQESVRRSLSMFTSEAPVLAPGQYRLDVVSGWVDEAVAGSTTAWTTESAAFEVGGPPGLRTGATGPLNDLATYIDSTVPASGERPFYRSYDIGVAFSHDYVSRMFLENATPLVLGVVDANERVLRPGSPNVWGRGPDLALTAEETDWLATLHDDGTEPCASIDTSSVSRNEVMHGGAGEVLPAAQLCTGRLGGGNAARLFEFDFVTSRYVSFAHHLACFAGARSATSTGSLDGAALRVGLAPAEQAVIAARAAVVTAGQGVAAGTPTSDQFAALTTARAGLDGAKASLDAARRAGFAAAAAVSGVAATRPRPAGVEVTVVAGGLLIESDEPIGWDRLTAALAHLSAVPQHEETIAFGTVGFGGPDAGSFVYVGRLWRTTAELWAKDDAVRARLEAPWTLSLELAGVTRVDAVVDVPPGGTVVLGATGIGASSDATSTTTGPTTLSVTGTALSGCTITGSSHAIRSISLVSAFAPGPCTGLVRILTVSLPATAGGTDHFVELMADDTVDLTGCRLEWRPADASAPWQTYHELATGRSLPTGGIARIVGGVVSGTPVSCRDTWFGGTTGSVPASGIVVRLLDAGGSVAHERAAMPAGAAVPFGLVPDGDLTRAYVIPAAPAPGWWTLGLTYARDLGPGEAQLSVAGDSSPEIGTIGFIVPS